MILVVDHVGPIKFIIIFIINYIKQAAECSSNIFLVLFLHEICYRLQKIPPIGSMKYEDFIGDKMFLEVPNGSVWPVELSRRDCEIWLRKGWQKFARFYFLELGCLLLFIYKGVYSHFQVRIFRRNTLEMDYFNLSDEDETDSNSSGEIECQRMKHDKERRTHGIFTVV